MQNGCRTERMVRYKPFFSGVGEAKTQTPAVGATNSDYARSVPASIVIENPDGSKTLLARSGRHLLTHILSTTRADEADLFTDQVLSDITRQEYIDRGLDPRQAFAALKERRQDIAMLTARMPMGEYSPNVIMSKIGPKMYRVRLSGQSAADLEWIGFDMVMERGNWKLRWFF